jgi:type I restriction enzyme S subunit
MNIVGPPLGKIAIIPDTFPEWNCNQAISFFRPIFPVLAPYLYTFLCEGSFLENIQLIGTAGQDNISVTKCKFIPVPLPPLNEQRRIVAKVDQLMALVDTLETELTASRTLSQQLLESAVGQLTNSGSNSNNAD